MHQLACVSRHCEGKLALGLYNLFDVRFNEPAAGDTTVAGARWTMPQLGRTAMLTARLGF